MAAKYPHRLARLLPMLVLAAMLGAVAHGQMPGMDEEPAPVATAPAPVTEDTDGHVRRLYLRFLGEESPYRPVILVVVTLLVVLKTKSMLTKAVRTHVEGRALKAENAQTFMRVWNNLWKFVIAILVIMAMSGSLRLLGLTVGFLGMMLGWSLQQPVTGIAAWLMVILKKPFRIGDRVIIAGIIGDVTDITLTHIVLNQVGGTVGGEERSGRGILIPNAILFQNIIINYTLEQKYTLSEIPVRINFDCDWERAKEIMLEAAATVTADVIAETGTEPMVRVEFLDWGILARLRFQCVPTDRERISTEVIELLLREFRKEYPRIRFAVPHSRIDYEHEGGSAPFAPNPATGSSPTL